jgi:hypothetical protein
MEKTINNVQPKGPEPEAFVVNDPEVGKTFIIRELADAQLERYAVNAEQGHAGMTRQAMALLGQAVEAAKAAAIFRYEQDRRRRTVTLATPSDIDLLRRQ